MSVSLDYLHQASSESVPDAAPAQPPLPPVREEPQSPVHSKGLKGHVIAFLVLSILQFVGLLGSVYLTLAWTYWTNPVTESNPVKNRNHDWFTQIFLHCLGFSVPLFLAITSCMGVWAATAWLRLRTKSAQLQLQARRLWRAQTPIAIFDITVAGSTLLMSLIALFAWGAPVALLALLLSAWFLAHFSCCVVFMKSMRRLAEAAAVVPGDVEFTVHASFLFCLSTLQVFAAPATLLITAAGYDWSNASEGFAAFCYLLGSLAALFAALVGLHVTGSHLFGNKSDLAAKGLASAYLINSVVLVSGGPVAGLIRGSKGVDAQADTLCICVFLLATIALEARMHYLVLRLRGQRDMQRDPVKEYVDQAAEGADGANVDVALVNLQGGKNGADGAREAASTYVHAVGAGGSGGGGGVDAAAEV